MGLNWVYFGLSLASIGTFLSITLKMTYFIFFAKPDKEFEVRAIPKNMYWAMGISAFLNVIFGIVPFVLYKISAPLAREDVYHPYTVDHVTQYIEVLVAAMIPFMLYLPHMKPRGTIFCRWISIGSIASRWLAWLAGLRMSAVLYVTVWARCGAKFTKDFGPISANPMRFIGRLTGKNVP